MKKKSIWDYFDEHIDYPTEVVHNTLPYGTVWCYISSTFLNGMVNYTKPVKLFALERYTASDKIVQDNLTKKDVIDNIIENSSTFYNINLSIFRDDVVLLSEIETNDEDDKNRFMFFWFDCDLSDCCIGKFETTDTKEEVCQSIIDWLEGIKEKKKGYVVHENNDNGILDYTEIPVSCLSGWIKF